MKTFRALRAVAAPPRSTAAPPRRCARRARDGGGAAARRRPRDLRAGPRPRRRPARLAPLRAAGVRRRVRARPRPGRLREALPRARLDAGLDRRGARLRRPPHAGSRAVPRRDPSGRAVRDGRPRDLPAARAAPRLARAEDLPPAAELGFDGVAITDSLGILGSPYAPYWARLALRAGADLVLTTSAARREADRRRARAARAGGRARREARQGAALPPLSGVPAP